MTSYSNSLATVGHLHQTSFIELLMKRSITVLKRVCVFTRVCVSPGSQPAGGLQPSGLLLHLLRSDLAAGAAAEEE